MGQVWGVSPCRSYVSHLNNTLGTLRKFEFKATPLSNHFILSLLPTSFAATIFLHICFLRGMSKSLGLMILLVHLKFCWRILNFAGMVFEAKVAPAKDLRQQYSAGAHQEIPLLICCDSWMVGNNQKMPHIYRMICLKFLSLVPFVLRCLWYYPLQATGTTMVKSMLENAIEATACHPPPCWARVAGQNPCGGRISATEEQSRSLC